MSSKTDSPIWVKEMLVDFLRFCDDRDKKITNNNFKYFQDYADDFLEQCDLPKEDQQPSGDVEKLAMDYANQFPDNNWNDLYGAFKAGYSANTQPIKEDTPIDKYKTYDSLLERVKIALFYRDFGVLNEYLIGIGENKIPAPQPQTDTPIGDDVVLRLIEFLNDNIDKSQNATGMNKIYISGWISALVHVRENFAKLNTDRQSKEIELKNDVE
jgi:hypothetical protein